MQGRRTNMRHRAERKRKRLKTSKKAVYKELKLVSAICYEIFIFSPNNSPLKTTKNVFYFMKKALFILEIFKFF